MKKNSIQTMVANPYILYPWPHSPSIFFSPQFSRYSIFYSSKVLHLVLGYSFSTFCSSLLIHPIHKARLLISSSFSFSPSGKVTFYLLHEMICIKKSIYLPLPEEALNSRTNHKEGTGVCSLHTEIQKG